MAEIKLLNLSKSYHDKEVLKDFDLVIRDGEMLSLLGPSGCGKTTLLKVIAGLEKPTNGRVLFNGKDLTGVEANKRNAIIVFQDCRLFPHMTVYQNIEFGLKVRKMSNIVSARLVNEMIEITQLSGCESKYPAQLSGGQKQRAALARALVVKPGVLLLDEPFSNLDTSLRANMREFVLKLQKELHFTSVLVTHDKEEAFMSSNRTAVMIEGRLQQVDAPENIYSRPKTKALADFLGEVNFIGGSVKDGIFQSALWNVPVNMPDKEDALLMLRYGQLEITDEDTGIPCEIIEKRFGGRDVYYKIKTDHGLKLVIVSSSNAFNLSDKPYIRLKTSQCVVY